MAEKELLQRRRRRFHVQPDLKRAAADPTCVPHTTHELQANPAEFREVHLNNRTLINPRANHDRDPAIRQVDRLTRRLTAVGTQQARRPMGHAPSPGGTPVSRRGRKVSSPLRHHHSSV